MQWPLGRPLNKGDLSLLHSTTEPLRGCGKKKGNVVFPHNNFAIPCKWNKCCKRMQKFCKGMQNSNISHMLCALTRFW